jgi:predicted dehydrogenase
MIQVAIIGGGFIGPRHAQSVISNPSTNLVALVEPSSSGPEIAARFNTHHYPSVPALLADSENKPNAAIVCTPNHTHVAIAQELLSAGVHVLVEKPISSDIDTGRTLVRYVQEIQNQGRHVQLLVGHHRRFNPYIVKTKEILDSGSLGRIIAVNGLWTLFKPPEYFAPPTEWRQSKHSGGVILINLAHDIDLLQYLFGPIVRVHAESASKQRPSPPHNADEGAALNLRFASGVVGTFLVCDATPSPYNFETGTGENLSIPKVPRQTDAGISPPSTNFYHIFGSDASLSVPDMSRWSYDGRASKSWTQPLCVEKFDVDESVTPYEAQLAHFVDLIRGEAEPSCSGIAGLQALIVCEAIRKSSESGETVDIDIDTSLNVL